MPPVTGNEIRQRSESSQIFTLSTAFLDDPLAFIETFHDHAAIVWAVADFGTIVMGERPDGIIPVVELGDGPLDINELLVL